MSIEHRRPGLFSAIVGDTMKQFSDNGLVLAGGDELAGAFAQGIEDSGYTREFYQVIDAYGKGLESPVLKDHRDCLPEELWGHVPSSVAVRGVTMAVGVNGAFGGDGMLIFGGERERAYVDILPGKPRVRGFFDPGVTSTEADWVDLRKKPVRSPVVCLSSGMNRKVTKEAISELTKAMVEIPLGDVHLKEARIQGMRRISIGDGVRVEDRPLTIELFSGRRISVKQLTTVGSGSEVRGSIVESLERGWPFGVDNLGESGYVRRDDLYPNLTLGLLIGSQVEKFPLREGNAEDIWHSLAHAWSKKRREAYSRLAQGADWMSQLYKDAGFPPDSGKTLVTWLIAAAYLDQRSLELISEFARGSEISRLPDRVDMRSVSGHHLAYEPASGEIVGDGAEGWDVPLPNTAFGYPIDRAGKVHIGGWVVPPEDISRRGGRYFYNHEDGTQTEIKLK